MKPLTCTGCGGPLEQGAIAYGLTLGVVDYPTMYGFEPCNASPWEAVWHLDCYVVLDQEPEGPLPAFEEAIRGLASSMTALKERLRAAKEGGTSL
ncbi:hypothetical protein LCGC14_1938960 [marine sediment metagenome]|uniref:PARP-type domain-containing protein n=1 Tax=marine sediment metagenome TaxID=412755 RepID=A0A0F9FL53_9ZZZZ